MKTIIPPDYKTLLVQVKERVRSAQYAALKAVNRELISLYWEVGGLLSSRRRGSVWGKSVVESLACDLQKEFPGISGFSSQNLWRMKQFYEAYVGNERLSPLVREIAWTHNVIILMNCKNDLEREFYIRWARKCGWSKNVLIHQIESKAYERTFLSQTNFEKTLPKPLQSQAKLSIKDEYTFDFLELGDVYSERKLEQALLSKVDHFLREMGGLFSFVGNQFRVELEDKEYFIDLLLYHRRLRCLVAVELKIGEFLPEYVGKMQFYLALLDDRVREKGENPSIGIILCKSKNKTVVEYALRQSQSPIGVAACRVVKKLPKSLEGQLPAPEQIQQLLDDVSV
jgi:predicted nuclease of restriction endonuclease-like (RecB) superfamily